MANKHRGEVEISIDGKPRTLRFTFAALESLEQAAGFESVADLGVALDRFSFALLRKMLWAGLLHETPDLKAEDIGNPDGALLDWTPTVVRAVMIGLYPEGAKETADGKNADGAAGSDSPSPTPSDSRSAAESANGISGT